ncbi:MAG TPA: hypothetical protein ENJ43_08530 [Gammaproteobacteria bacterium]|nr:hypothetical protein [Gammaproteobacteria bacterium]
MSGMKQLPVVAAAAANGGIRKRIGHGALVALVALLLLPLCAAGGQVEFVVHVSVDGLRPDAITILGHAGAPNFYRLRAEGAFTDNARTDANYLGTLPNHISQLTGRAVAGAAGHNYGDNREPPAHRTLHSHKGAYLASVFDVVHDHGLSTALFTGKEKFRIFRQSYDGSHGAPDRVGVDNGRNKIDRYVCMEDTRQLLEEYLAAMRAAPFNYSLLHLRDPDSAGHRYYWDVTPGSEYMKAVRRVDGMLGKLLRLIGTDSRLAGRTVLVVTADHGGTYGSNHTILDSRKNYTIPFYVWGPGIVPPAADLYALNRHSRLDPGTGRPPNSASPQPIREGDVANLVLDLLGLGPIEGSTINRAQDLEVRGGPSAAAPPP